jgi:hypothetical protein
VNIASTNLVFHPDRPIMLKKNVKRAPLTIKERNFVAQYVKTKNATEAAFRVYDVSSRDSARKIGSEKLAKLDISGIMDEMGLSDDKLLKVLSDGLKATKPKIIHTPGIAKIDIVLTDDYVSRHRYLEIALRLRGHLSRSINNKLDANQKGWTLNDVFNLLEK